MYVICGKAAHMQALGLENGQWAEHSEGKDSVIESEKNIART